MAKILDGKALSTLILGELKARIARLKRAPCVAFVLAGDNPASVAYVTKKGEAAASIGIQSRLEKLPANASEATLIATVQKLAVDKEVDGILVQAPLPAGVCPTNVFNAVPADKDVDGFSAHNLGLLAQDRPEAFVACTPLGVLELLRRNNIPIQGKHVVVIGRSLIVGRPLATLLGQREAWANATVTSANKETENLPALARSADILITATGHPELVKADWVKPGATVIDVGQCRVADATRKSGYRLCGDVDFDAVEKIAGAITPVPGGVGPMTIAMLMQNTVKAAELHQ